MTTEGQQSTQISAPKGLAECLALLPKLQEIGTDNLAAAKVVVRTLGDPATAGMILAEASLLLETYWISDRPREMVKREAERWAEALAEYPEWAVKLAMRWWTRMENPRRSYRPVEGDIELKAHELTSPLRALKIRIATFEMVQARDEARE